MESIEQILQNTTGENESKTDWTKAWSAKYPVLADYRNKVDVSSWARRVRALLNELAEEYGFSERYAMQDENKDCSSEWKAGCGKSARPV